MKKNKGFTLIELLAIIVILALIAVIISPIILGIIEDSKLSAATDSAYGYKEAIGKYYASQLSQNSDFMLNGEYTIGTDGSISDEENNYPILVSGTVPNSGYLTIEKGAVTAGCIQINEFAVRIEDKKVTSTEKGYCVEPPVIVEEFPQVTDENPGIICGNGDTEDYDNSTICYIYSVEDLVAFSNMVNSGKNFSGKTVQLMNNLDIENDKSYSNINVNQFGDVNENSTTSTTLKEELTDETAKGFKPIGNNSKKFSGTFEGNTKTIKNLFINRSSENYIGLFGYNEGTIKGLKVTYAEITGYQYVGLIVGQNIGNMTSTIAKGNITGYRWLGLATGNNSGGTVETVVEGDITGTYNSTGSACIGGITGQISGNNTKGINLSGTITTTSGYAYKTIGNKSDQTPSTIASETVTAPSSQEGLNKMGGYTVSQSAVNNIGIMETVLDTYIGGDNNNDGYYYDNDTNGNITIYSLLDKPLDITMDGEGTQDEPFIINNYDDLKQVAYNAGNTGSGIYYKLNADIDMANKNQIALGRGTGTANSNQFKGIFDGNAHTIRNINIYGYNYTGFFGFNAGTIKGLTITSSNVSGHENVGLIAGYNTGTITDVITKGNVSGYMRLGLTAGYTAGTIRAVVAGNITGTYNSTGYACIGGIVGQTGVDNIKGINLDGTITTTSGYAYKTVGHRNDHTPTTIASETVTAPTSEEGLRKMGGKTVTVAELQTLAPYQEVGLNTSSTSGEYRYELDSNYNPYLVKN